MGEVIMPAGGGNQIEFPPLSGPFQNVDLVGVADWTAASLAPPDPPPGTKGMLVEALITGGGPGQLLQLKPTGATSPGDVQSLFLQGGPIDTRTMVIKSTDGSFEYTLSEGGPTANIRIIAWILN